MANDFSKEEKVAFEQLLEGFNDALVMSRNVNVYNYNINEYNNNKHVNVYKLVKFNVY